MAPIRNARVLFVEAPLGYPEPEKHTTYDASQTIDPDSVPLNGGFLLKTLVISVDPYIRTLMRIAYKKGEPIFSFGVGVVLRSENAAVKAGDHIYGMLALQEYVVVPDVASINAFRIIESKEGLPWSAYVGVAGMPGQTAYVGWKEYADPQEGDTVFVSSAAGPVGTLVCQMAKKAGLKVIASAGSDDKVAFLRSIGVDAPFNYKTTDTAEILKKEGPINIYWDGVGGATLDTALAHAARGARFIECGMISVYNGTPPPMHNLPCIFRSELKLFGFIVTTLLPKYAKAFYEEVPAWLASGEVRFVEDRRVGLECAGQAIFDVQVGKTVGKGILVVGEDV